ncbi:hypothetical protein LJC40_02690 [Synergistaceae bacterium OttesenSCG-928-D05]|nr:hypothetical protein [Synergistaceae bacterium OttesenSCG-928-D05]
MTEKVWAVTLSDGLKVTQIELFDNESDADNFAHEMASSGKGHYQVLETNLNMRDEKIAGEPRWTELTTFNAQCIECLVQDIIHEQEKPFDEAACAKFLEEHKVELQKEADDVIHELLKKRLHDYVNNERIILG